MARAKNTDRAAARRRTRELNRPARAGSFDDDASLDTPSSATASPGDATIAGNLRGAFRLPDWRGDLRILPGMLRHSWKLWIPFIALLVSFVLAVLLAQAVVTSVLVAPGIFGFYEHGRILPVSLDGIVGLYVNLTLPPTALFVFFVAGFLAPRASYLVGALVGLVDGILWSLLFLIAPKAQLDATARVVTLGDFVAILMVAVVVGTLAAGFAAWYRNFLRQSQERAKMNRMAREQQQRAKAKDDARKEKEAQRQAAAAARQAKTPGR